MTRVRTLQRSIGWRFALAALVPVVLLGGAVLYWATGVETVDTEVENRLLARAVRAEVHGFLAQPLGALQQIAAAAAAAEDSHSHVVQDTLNAVVKAFPYFESVFLLDSRGTITRVALAEHNQRHREDFLGLDRSRERFFLESRDTGAAQWSDVFQSLLSGHRSMSLSMPAGDGLLVVTFSIEALGETIAEFMVDPKVVPALIDRKGVLLFHPDPELAAQNLNLRHLAPVSASLQGRELTTRYSWRGTEYLGSALRLPGSGWTVLVSQTRADALAPVRQVTTLFFTGIAGAVLVALVAATLVARLLVRPLNRLQDQAREIAGGHYQLDLPPQRYREVEELAAGFRAMAGAVANRERELSASRERFQQLFNNNNDAIFVRPLGPGGELRGLVEVNAMACTLLGYDRETLLAMSPEHFLGETDRARFADVLAALAAGGAPRVELHLRAACGEQIPVEVQVHHFELEGTPTVMSVARDIRARHQAEQRLAESERRYRRLAESTSAVPWEVDVASGRFTYIGPQVEALFGYPRDSWATVEAWAERILDEDRAEAVAYCQAETAAGRDHEFFYRMRDTRGRVRWVHDLVSVIPGPAGTHRMVGLMLDITAARQAEEDKRVLEERLRQAQRLEAVGTLAGGIAHDFNNILGAIMGFSELTLLDLPAGAPQRENIQQVLQAAHRAKDIVKQILAFSRKAEEARRPVEMRLIVKEALTLLRASIPSTIEIRQRVEPDSGLVLADPSQMHQVLVNLVTNAYQAMRDTGGVLTVELHNTTTGADGREHVDLVVADSGPGIPPEVQQRIFEPYFTTKAAGEGSGLGLAVVHGIVTGHGGALSVRSTPGEGAAFTVRLPRHRGGQEKAPASPAEPARGSGCILLVDDEETLTRLGSLLLESLGYLVVTCNDPAQALEMIRTDGERFDLLITDQTMPGLTGADLTREVFALRPDLPVLICTGFSETLDREQALSLGARDLLFKPLALGTLSRTVGNLLHHDPAPPA